MVKQLATHTKSTTKSYKSYSESEQLETSMILESKVKIEDIKLENTSKSKFYVINDILYCDDNEPCFCIYCHCYMGPHNYRQYCMKDHCPAMFKVDTKAKVGTKAKLSKKFDKLRL